MNRLFPRLPIPETLALEFLGTFARCEYALKGSGYARGGATSVQADWDAFASDIDWHFRRVKNAQFRAAVKVLLSDPPRKQVLRNGRVAWKVAPADTSLPKAQQVLLLVRRIRNNLFHGAKVWTPEYSNRAKDVRFLEAGLVVLKHCVRLKADVHAAYDIGAF